MVSAHNIEHSIAGPYREPGLIDLFVDIWRAKFYLCAGIFVGVIAAFVFFAIAQPQYRAEMLVGPAERGTGPDIKALLPENSSFAVQYLVNSLGSQDSNDFIRFEHMMRGVTTASLLQDDKAVIDGLAKSGLFRFERDDKEPLNAVKLAVFLQEHVQVLPVGTAPLRRIVFSHPDSDFAAYLLERLYEETDRLIRADILQKTKARGDYLQKAIADTNHPDHRRALTSLLMEQEHIRMVLDMNQPFAAIMVEPPVVGSKPDWPRKTIFWPLFIVLGGFLGFVIFLTRRHSKTERP